MSSKVSRTMCIAVIPESRFPINLSASLSIYTKIVGGLRPSTKSIKLRAHSQVMRIVFLAYVQVHSNLFFIYDASLEFAWAWGLEREESEETEECDARAVNRNMEALGKRLEELQKVLQDARAQAEKQREKSLLRKAPWEA